MTATGNNYVAVSRRALDLEDYIDVAKRHAVWIAGPVFAGMVLSICIAFVQPNVYESHAVLEIAPSQIPDDLVKNTVNLQLRERIIQMGAGITSRNTLSAIIQDPRLDLYKEERATKPLDDVVEIMRRDVGIAISQGDPSSRNGASTFTISFKYPQRLKATATVTELVSRFTNESIVQQRDQQNSLKEIFGDETTQAEANLRKSQQDLTNFRNANPGRLPELYGMNMGNLTSLQQQANGIGEELNRLSADRVRLEQQRVTLQSQLQLAESMGQDFYNGTSTPASRQNEDLASMNRQIDAGDLHLQQLLQQFKPTYPDIRDLQKQLDLLKRRRDDLEARQQKELADEAAKPKPVVKKPTNYQAEQNKANLQGQIDATNALLRVNDSNYLFKEKQADNLNKQIEGYRQKLEQTSSLEAKYADLQREYADAGRVYQDALNKKQLTAQHGELISRNAIEHLQVLDNPSIPTKQISPNRLQTVGLGFGLSLVLGLALAGIQEAKDTSLKNLKDVRAYTNLPVLSSIPLLENTVLVKRKRRITYVVWSAVVIVGLLAVGATLFYYSTVTANS